VGASSAGGGTSVQVNHLSVGRLSGGATVERGVPTELGQGEHISIELTSTDFSTARRVVEVINERFAPDTAVAVNGRVIRLRAPASADERVTFIGQIESLEITPAQTSAKVIVNARTGSIVMNQAVMIQACAVAHGNLTVVINSEPVISQPSPLSTQGQTVVAERAQVEIRADKSGLTMVKAGVSLGDVVKSLNAIGATPQDLLAILQAMKAAGALRAELEII
jgi:flagellar P-ring protein precursor FlgI